MSASKVGVNLPVVGTNSFALDDMNPLEKDQVETSSTSLNFVYTVELEITWETLVKSWHISSELLSCLWFFQMVFNEY